MNQYKVIIPALMACATLTAQAQETKDSVKTGKPDQMVDQLIQVGYQKTQRLEESTGSVSTVYNEDFNHRSAKNIANSLYGQGTGLTTLQNSGSYADSDPTFYVRGLQSLSTNSALVLVDGIERDIKDVTAEEVESVSILKDAAAVAIYGYKGINGVINITTKRGKYNSQEVKVSFDHGMGWQARKPKFVDSYTYANAINEALANDGLSARYSDNELNAFRTGKYPYLYPNVNWTDETFRSNDATNIVNVSFRGGGEKLRYYAMANLTANNGFIKNANMNDGYSTQDQYSKANLRINLDADLTDKTQLRANVFGVLSETRIPGDGSNLWEMIYTLPSAAFPVKQENGVWGGSSTWAGTSNPVAMSQAAAYIKNHERSLFTDMTLTQDLSAITPGLGISGMFSYDNYALYEEDHSKTFAYGSYSATWADGEPSSTTYWSDGQESSMGDDSECTEFTRVFNFAGTLFYDKQINANNKIYAQLKYDYEYRNTKGVNTTYYRNNFSLYGHYGFKNRYFADLTLVASASNMLAPGHKWAFSPTLSLAWVASKEKFLQNVSWVNFLKLRASAGIINSDDIPEANYWEQTFSGGSYYPFDTNYTAGTTSYTLGRLAAMNTSHEKAYKYNFGFDASLLGCLDVNFDAYYERRSDIWVSSSGRYSSILGFTAPYENSGIVDSYGVELGLNFHKKVGQVMLNAGANFSLAKNEIKEQCEEPQLYDNLVTTGHPLDQTYGLIAIGFFKDQDDIDNSPAQHFTSTTVPGDVKYMDVNGDGIIDENDETAIGYSTTCPEIYYSFNLGAEWKGLGFTAQFQGTGRYSAVLNTESLYWPLINNTTISEEYYNNRWTEDAVNPKYPRLSSESNANNYQTSTLWLEDRSFLKLRSVELYYNFPEKWLKATKFMNKAKFYIRGVDLLCFDHIKIADPEAYGASYPLTRSVFAGLQLEF